MPSNPLGIYVSIPFCRAKCSYCNFASGVFNAAQKSAYTGRLCEEIQSAPERARAWGAVPQVSADTVYFGGGTPTSIGMNQLDGIVKQLHDCFTIAARTEFTMECAPGQLTDPLLDTLPRLGVNRVSLGVQSFVDREAAAVGRSHRRGDVLADIARLRRAGIEEINVDLIAGLPHQTPESWRDSLDTAVDTGVPHLSVYMLDVDDDSRLGREMLTGGTRYGAARVPEEQAVAAMYGEAVERFDGAGVAQYEISNFARPGHESRHNLKYWTRQPYLGFGLDAHSFLPVSGGRAIRAAVTDDLSAYLGGLSAYAGGGEPETVAPVSQDEAMEEAWFLGLRLRRGVSLPQMEREFGSAAMEQYGPVWRGCEREGLMEQSADRLHLTGRGRLFANEVFARFLGVLSPVVPS